MVSNGLSVDLIAIQAQTEQTEFKRQTEWHNSSSLNKHMDL